MKYQIAGIDFATKKAVQDHCRVILYAASVGTIVDAADEPFLRDLVSRHPSAAEKIGAGILRFSRRRNEYRTPGFWIERVDGSETDFSFLQCLNPRNPRKDYVTALRREVDGQVIAFRDLAFAASAQLVCPVRGETITRENSHVDHAPPDTFLSIVERFDAVVEWQSVVLVGGDGATGDRIVDASIAARWREFHATHARLRVVSARANLSEIRRGELP